MLNSIVCYHSKDIDGFSIFPPAILYATRGEHMKMT